MGAPELEPGATRWTDRRVRGGRSILYLVLSAHGKIYLGAMLNAALVTWMFVSSQVVAPIPV